MKCNAYIDPETKVALAGDAREAAFRDPAAPRCGYELAAGDTFCPACGAKVVEQSGQETGWKKKLKAIPKWAMAIGVAVVLVIICAVARSSGDAEAQFDRGVRYYKGDGVEQDMKEAVKRFRKAAEQGVAEAQFCLALCYYEGDGVAQDKEEAVKWYRKAAEQENADAQFCHCYCYQRYKIELWNNLIYGHFAFA